jgi:hypothetical protein
MASKIQSTQWTPGWVKKKHHVVDNQEYIDKTFKKIEEVYTKSISLTCRDNLI